MYFSIHAYSSHPDLTNTVCRKAGVKSGNVVLKKFANNETMVELNENVRVGLHCYHLYRTHSGNIYTKMPSLMTKMLPYFRDKTYLSFRLPGSEILMTTSWY